MSKTHPSTPDDLDAPQLYGNREISWLSFNQRVLEQACDKSWPLLERLKFLAIHGSNLDEFFMIRVSGLHDQLEAGLSRAAPDVASIRDQLARLREIVLEQQRIATDLLLRELLPALEGVGIRIRPCSSLEPEVREWARIQFRRSVFPVLTPLVVDPAHPFPFLSNLSVSLAIEAEDPSSGERRFARIKVPESLPRFIAIPHPESPTSESRQDFVALEDLIADNLPELFPGVKLLGCHVFRLTRDMDLDILEEEVDDLLSLVAREVRRRRFGAPVRLEVAPDLPEHVRSYLLTKLELGAEDLYETPGPLGISRLMELAGLPRSDLHDPPLQQRLAAELGADEDLFAAIRRRDILLHHPYDSFRPLLDLLETAADDPDVLAIKMTLYRAGANAEPVRSLIRAAENGKQIAVSIELKARFDEQNNIGWARALERAGAHVFYSAAGVKTHAKLLLIVRREAGELRRYVHLSTGNYNASTAKLYTDIGLLTCDPAFGEDATEFFNALSGFSAAPRYRRLCVAPIALRSIVLRCIEEQLERARSGERARIFAKMNSLVDKEVIRALYRASRAGVEIDLIVRGVCCLRPGIPGISERIRVRSLLGRFLEHERIFVFGVDENRQFYLSSADWMPRNLDRRVEVMFPITDRALQRRIERECIEPLAVENCRLYQMNAAGEYSSRTPDGVPPVDAQAYVIASAPGVRDHGLSHTLAEVTFRLLASVREPDRVQRGSSATSGAAS